MAATHLAQRAQRIKPSPTIAVTQRAAELKRQHQRRPLNLLNNVGHGEGLAAARDPQQRLIGFATLKAIDNRPDRLRLIASGLKIALKLKFFGHTLSVKPWLQVYYESSSSLA